MATCLVFVFAALIEFAYVNVLSRVEKRRRETLKSQSDISAPESRNGNEIKVSHIRTVSCTNRQYQWLLAPSG